MRLRLVLSNIFKPSSYFLTDRSNVELLLWILFSICVLCTVLSVLVACGRLLGNV